MRAGELNKRITFMIKSSGSSDEGYPEEQQYVSGSSCWAGVKPIRVKEAFAGNTERVIGVTLFAIRYRKDIDESMVISYDGSIYQIESIVDVNEGHFKLEIEGKKIK